MADKIAELRALLAAAAKGPWAEDDGNIFSRPLSEARTASLVRRYAGLEWGAHPDAGHRAPLCCIATTNQAHDERSDADAALICAAVNALPALLEIAELAGTVLADASPNRDLMSQEAAAWYAEALALEAALRKLEAL